MTEEAKHSAAPWFVDGPSPAAGRNPNMGLWSVEGARNNVANNCTLADAHLISAAPDLATELRDLVDWLEANQRTIEGMFSMDDLLAGPRAALSKALGQDGESAS